MTTSSTEVIETKEIPVDKDPDTKPMVPLRQRKLPASFWQEPCKASNYPTVDSAHVAPAHPFPATILSPWAMTAAPLPTFTPHRVGAPGGVALVQHPPPMWIRSPMNFCNCAVCLNYSYVIPRFSEFYPGLRYRSPTVGHCTPDANCSDQGCKLCTPPSCHPERVRQSRLRSARYNALAD